MKKITTIFIVAISLLSCNNENQTNVTAIKETTIWTKEVTYSTGEIRLSTPINLEPEMLFIDVIFCGTSVTDTVRTEYADGYREVYTNNFFKCN